MRAGQRERRRVVIESCASPIRRGMACSAGSRESGGGVRWSVSPVVIRLVASVASCRQSCVVVVCVALCTRRGRMRAGEREDCRVIEGGRCPVGGRVAQGAVGGETGSDVRGICGSCEVLLVAAVTSCWQSRVIVVHVARGARDRDVSAGERERRCVVIETCASPIRRGMACFTGGGEADGGVRRAGGSVPILLVAGVAGSRR